MIKKWVEQDEKTFFFLSPWITIAFGVLCFILGLRSVGVAFPSRRLIVSMLR